MSKKICFVTTISTSLENFVYPYVHLLQEKGYDVTFVSSCSDDFINEYEKKNIKVYNIPIKRGFDFKGTFFAIGKFKKICDKNKFDIVFYATPNAGLYASIASRIAKVPCRVLGHWGLRYLGFAGWKRKLVCNLEKIACFNSTDIRMVSESNRAIAIKDGMYKPEKCKVIGKGGTVGVNLELYKKENIPQMRQDIREKLGIPKDSLVYTMVGRVCKDKGFGEMVQAFEKVQKENNDVYLTVLGRLDSNSMLSQDILDRAEKNPNIILCGLVPRNEVPSYLAAADVLVHPAYREGLGMVLLEAAAMYLPTITTNIPGASEAIVNGETGLLAESHDVETLAEAMTTMFDGNLRKSFGENGRRMIDKYFDRNLRIELLCQDYEELYKKRIINKE